MRSSRSRCAVYTTPARASVLPGIIAPASSRSDHCAMNEYVLLICAILAIVGTVARLGIAMSVQTPRPSRIEWDDPTEAEA